MEKRLIIALILAVTISMALMFALIFARPIIIIAQSTNHTTATQENACITPGCIKAASQILERLDTNEEPCHNFYKFACGNYIKNTVIPANKVAVNTLLLISDKIQEQLRDAIEAPVKHNETGTTALIKNYYQACRNTTSIEKNGMEALLSLLQRLGGWPVLGGDKWNEDDFDWKELMVKFRKEGIDTDWFIVVIVSTDLKNSSQNMIQIKQPEFGIRQEHLIKGPDEDYVKAYYDYMVDVAVLLGAKREKAREELRESLELEIRLANFSLSEVEAHEVAELYNILSIAELQQKYPNIPWLEYLAKVIGLGIHLNSSEKVLLTTPVYVSLFQHFIEEIPRRTQANYALWRTIKELIPFSTSALRDLQLQFNRATSGVSAKLPRWQECMNEATSRLPILAGSLYVRNYFDHESKKSVLEIVKYIRKAFKEILENADWMDADTQRNALDKAAAVAEHIGYPDELLDDTKVKEIYKEVETYTDQYLQSYLSLNRFTVDFFYSSLRKPANSSYWVYYANPAMVKAYYYPTSNSIVFTAGILQDLLFGTNRPRYMNFGAIGAVIGHELTHGFDYSGRNLDKNGVLVDWWAPKTKELFLKKSECIIQQYGNYTVPELKQHLHGVNTKNENIADNGGVKQAYLAYQAWEKANGPELKLPGLDYTPKQLFWISYATQWCAVYKSEILKTLVASNSHAPNEFRVVGPLSNSENFAKDFNCKAGTRMNPAKKCSVW